MLNPLLQRYREHLVLDAGGWSERNEHNRALATRVFLEGMQETGLQAANVAARDLQIGPEELHQLEQDLHVQFLSANVFVDGKLRFQPYIVLQKDLGGHRVRIGITAVTTPSQLAIEEWPAPERLEISDPMQAAKQMLEGLRPQTDIRILLAHVPLATLEEFARSEPDGYDLLICGTGEIRETVPIGPTPAVLSPGTQAKHLAWVNLRHPRAGATEICGGQVLALDERIGDDAAMAARVAQFKERLAAAGGTAAPAAHDGSTQTGAATGATGGTPVPP